MKKLLFVCDGDNYPKGAFEFIKLLNNNEALYLKGLFFAAIDFQELIPVSYMPLTEPYLKFKEKEKKLGQKSREQFIKDCELNDIKNISAFENEEWDKGLFINETRFADALVISEELFYSDVFGNQPNLYLREVLHNAECPVIVVPETFNTIERIVVAYDGKKESMLALKQFCYLLPQLAELPADVVYIKNDKNNDIPNLELLKEFTRLHFNSSGVCKLHFDAYKDFTTWAGEKKNILIVAGSFGRSAVSNLMRSSFTHQIIQDHRFPLFVAHNS